MYNVLVNNGFQISNHEINHSLTVNEISISDKMKHNNRKRLKKCIAKGYYFKQVFDDEELIEVYSIIEENRRSKGHSVSMTLSQILDLYKMFPESVFFFKTSIENNAIASSICIKINKLILYVFYWGDLPGYNLDSPITHLVDGIYDFAQKNKFSLLDAGTSSISGIPNYGLVKFKENLGFTLSIKSTYTKEFIYE